MKNFLSCVISVIVIGIVALCVYVLWQKHNAITEHTTVDTTAVEKSIIDVVDPTFTSVDMAVQLKQRISNNQFVDSVFVNMSEQALIDVSSVCIKRNGKAKKRDIVNEYLNNKSIYDNLPKGPTANLYPNNIPTGESSNATKTDVEDPPTRVDSQVVVSTAFNYKDTTIDGKKVKIETKTTTFK